MARRAADGDERRFTAVEEQDYPACRHHGDEHQDGIEEDGLDAVFDEGEDEEYQAQRRRIDDSDDAAHAQEFFAPFAADGEKQDEPDGDVEDGYPKQYRADRVERGAELEGEPDRALFVQQVSEKHKHTSFPPNDVIKKTARPLGASRNVSLKPPVQVLSCPVQRV